MIILNLFYYYHYYIRLLQIYYFDWYYTFSELNNSNDMLAMHKN
jgi:hypothetical protein